ncbi:MAG TPA: hypothetical protein VLB12_09575 [Gemmatimonadales bacterium]|nr:hypothetical protein [Gemmatimonadales bacterium]
MTVSMAPRTIHDFGALHPPRLDAVQRAEDGRDGRDLYRMQYPAPGDPALARMLAVQVGASSQPNKD